MSKHGGSYPEFVYRDSSWFLQVSNKIMKELNKQAAQQTMQPSFSTQKTTIRNMMVRRRGFRRG